jgi:hypothetical protein
MTAITYQVSKWTAGLCGLVFGLTLGAVGSMAIVAALG